jgi:glycosyltransferase involved in cell wall biosynthesis
VASTRLLSVVVTSYTTERLPDVYELLASIKAQSYPYLETVFVAERSTELCKKVKSYGDENSVPNLKVVFNDGEQGASAARNLGVKEAKGDIIAFVDDDTVLFPDWADEMVKAYLDSAIVGVTGPAFPLWEDKSMSWFPEEFYWITSCTAWCDWQRSTDVRNIWTMNGSFAREVFDGGDFFSPDCGLRNGKRTSWRDPPSEEIDLSMRVKEHFHKRIIYAPDVKVQHRVGRYRLGWRFISQRSYSVGYQRRLLRTLYPHAENGKDNLSQEHQLLKRIFTRLLPDIFRTFFTHPVVAGRKLHVTVTSLIFVSLGYYSYLFSRQSGKLQRKEIGS